MPNVTQTAETKLNFWIMKNMSTSEYDSITGVGAWAEWDRITDSRDDDNSSSSSDDSDDD